MKTTHPSPSATIDYAKWLLKKHSSEVTTLWQSTKEVTMMEVLNFFSVHPMYQDDKMDYVLESDKQWVRVHALERVGGEPLNPPPSYKLWKGAGQAAKFREEGEAFSHSYPERIWAPNVDGIRYKLGNLGDVITLLVDEPETRQAFLPIFFPEDTGRHHGNRIPCTIGYHFIIRDGKIHTWYWARSIDATLHLRNDIYFANYLTNWIRSELKILTGIEYEAGNLTINIANLHCAKALHGALDRF
jgi:thymidylate synthase